MSLAAKAVEAHKAKEVCYRPRSLPSSGWPAIIRSDEDGRPGFSVKNVSSASIDIEKSPCACSRSSEACRRTRRQGCPGREAPSERGAAGRREGRAKCSGRGAGGGTWV